LSKLIQQQCTQFLSQEGFCLSTRSISALQTGETAYRSSAMTVFFQPADQTGLLFFVQAWRQISTLRLGFWVSTASDAAFEVNRGSAVLVPCPI